MKTKLLLSLTVLLAFLLRFYQLGVNPPSLSWDEASIGYNAYSIAETLRDEHGRFLPIDYFSAFGDYKPPVSIYLTAMSVKLFGMSEWSIRMPSAFACVLTVLLLYLLMEELRGFLKSNFLNSYFSLLASFILAVSPWHTLLSRQMFEANIATFFIVLGFYFFIKALNSKPWLFIPSAISFAASLYTFNSPRLFVPILFFGILIFYRHEIKKNIKWFLVFCLTFVVVMLPLVPHLASPLGQLRFREVNIFTDPGVVKKANERMELDKNDLTGRIVHNRRIGYTLLYLNHFMDHFNIDYLFFKGDINPKFSTRSTGQMFLPESLFIVAGIYFLLKKEKKTGLFFLFWLLAGLVPASFARETPHALRSEVSLPAWQIFSAAGIFFLYNLLVSKWRKILCIVIISAFIFQFSVYLHNYYVHLPIDYSQDWQYGYKIAAKEIQPLLGKYDKIWVSDKYGRPYIFFLMYQNYSPADFQNNQNTTVDSFGFYHVNAYGKYLFGATDMSLLKGSKILYIGDSGEIPEGTTKIKDIYFLNGEKALTVAGS